MAETQKSIGDWAKQTFPGGDDLAPRHVLRLLEEVVELAFAVGANRDDILASVGDAIESDHLKTGRGYASRHSELPAKIAAEMADVAIVLAVLAERRSVDLATQVDTKMAINRGRTWKANGDGTGYHVKADATQVSG